MTMRPITSGFAPSTRGAALMGGTEDFNWQQGIRMAGDALAAQANIWKAKEDARAIRAGAKADMLGGIIGGISSLASAGIGQLGAAASSQSTANAGNAAGAKAFSPGFDAGSTWRSGYALPSYGSSHTW